jgi:uncharacterized membrane protein
VHLFELSPNCSLTTGTATLFYLSILAVALPVAGACAVLGFWPVLPFTGLELIGIWVALRLSLRRGRTREFIRIDEHEVIVSRCAGKCQEHHCFTRPWTQVRLRPAAVAGWPSSLTLGAMGRSVEVGAFLTEAERQRLGRRLGELLGVQVR